MTQASLGSPGRAAAWACVGGGAGYLVLVGGGYAGIYLAQVRLISVVIALVAIGAWAVVAARSPSWRPRTTLWPAFVAAGLALAVSAAASTAPRLSADILAYAVILAALYLLLQRLSADAGFRDRIAGLAVLFSVAIGVLYLAASFMHWRDWWTALGRVAVPPLRPAYEALWFGNPSAVLAICVVLVASALAVVGWSSTPRRILAIGLVLLTGLAALVSGSRAGWFGVAAGLILTGLAWLAVGGHREVLLRAIARAPRAVVIGALGAAALGAVVFGPGVAGRLASGGGEAFRASLYVASVRMFEDRPLAGQGPGTWTARRATFTASDGIDFYIPHAHDIFLETGAELGTVGLAAGVVVVVALGRLLIRAVRDPDPTRRRWGWAAVFAVLYLAAHQVFDFYANMPAILFAVAIPIARLDATSTPRPDTTTHRLARGAMQTLAARAMSSRRAGVVAGLAGLAAVAAGSTWLIAGAGPALDNEAAVSAANSGDWGSARTYAAAAVAADPAMPAFQFTLGLAAAHVGDDVRALTAFRSGADEDDYTFGWLDVAAIEARAGRTPEAAAALDRAMRLGRQDPQLALAAGWLYETMGDGARSDIAYEVAIAENPTLVADPWWTASPERASRFGGLVDGAIVAAGPDVGWQVALFAGQSARASSLAASGSEAAGIGTEVVAAWNGDAAAYASLASEARSRPLDTGLLAWAALLAGHLGQPDDAAAFLTLANIDTSGAGGRMFGISFDPAPYAGSGGVDSSAYGRYTYLRPNPADLLVPGLPHIVVR